MWTLLQTRAGRPLLTLHGRDFRAQIPQLGFKPAGDRAPSALPQPSGHAADYHSGDEHDEDQREQRQRERNGGVIARKRIKRNRHRVSVRHRKYDQNQRKRNDDNRREYLS